MDKPKKIQNNPSLSELQRQIESVEALTKAAPLLTKFFPKMKEAFDKFPELKQQAEIIKLPDLFNERFASSGWLAYESMPLDIMKKAIEIFDADNIETAEQFLADSYNDELLKWGILRFNGLKEFRRRIRLVELAKEDYLAGRYHACIPLLLSLMDGIVNDITKHVGFFADSADMTAWDSIAGHETGLPAIASLLTRGKNKTNDQVISIPYRHGILHGRELAFDNKIVAAKTWGVLFAIKDWASAIERNKIAPIPKKEQTWSDIIKSLAENQRQNKLIREWKPRTSDQVPHLPFQGEANILPSGTPERAVAEFIENWISKRYGLIANGLVYFVEKPAGKKAGLAKEDFGKHIPIAYKILSVEDKSAAVSQVKAELKFKVDNQVITKLVNVGVNYLNSDNKPLVRSEDKGQWKIIQNSFSDILYRPTLNP